GLESQRHSLCRRGNMHRNQKIVDELHPTGGTERSKIEAGVGKACDKGFGARAGLLVSCKVDDGLAARDHSGCSAHFAVEEHGAFACQRSDVTLFVRNRVRTKLHEYLSRAR